MTNPLSFVDTSLRTELDDCLEIDENLKASHEQENRWDYMLGHGPSGTAIGSEPHSAHTKEISVVTRKRERAREQFREHPTPNAKVAEWFWVASGKVDFAPHEPAMRQVVNAGVTVVGGGLKVKHLEAFGAAKALRKKANR